MKKIEMYEANDGRAYKTPQEAEMADARVRLDWLVKSIANEEWRRVKMEAIFSFLISSDQDIWRIARELSRLRKIHNKYKEADIPF